MFRRGASLHAVYPPSLRCNGAARALVLLSAGREEGSFSSRTDVFVYVPLLSLYFYPLSGVNLTPISPLYIAP